MRGICRGLAFFFNSLETFLRILRIGFVVSYDLVDASEAIRWAIMDSSPLDMRKRFVIFLVHFVWTRWDGEIFRR